MNANRQTTVLQATKEERTMKITTSGLIRWAGLAAMGTGILYIAIQAIHPLDVLSSVTTTRWAVVHYLSIVMDMLWKRSRDRGPSPPAVASPVADDARPAA